jgi:hypothetical protein
MTRVPYILLLGLLLLGCDDRAASRPKAAAPPPAVIEHAGTIGGRVMFGGKAPELPTISLTGDAHCQKLHPQGLTDESVVVADDGAVANVLVYLKDAPRWDGGGRPAALLDQIGCQYVPHVVAVQINQPLRVKSSDSILHNVHILATVNPAENLSETGPGEQTIHFASAEIMHVRCDVHPWMKAIIGVFDSPYYAVTGADGKFEIRNVPPGTYTLAAWHERFGEQTQKITVGPDGTVTAKFAYAP